jgi:NADPH-dependent 2,4-dienoyl-CoA reductase/sulfur reductase-like enzyme/nitrite reductase/ring-hydroxylating ferredoxin subunit
VTDQPTELAGPDVALGIPLGQIPEGKLFAAHVSDKPVLLVRDGNTVYAVGATCTHYGGPLAEGLLVDGTVRCPWHHACYSLRTGEAIRAPALKPVATWSVEQRDGKVFVTSENDATDGAAPVRQRGNMADGPNAIVIIGGGAAGNAAAEMLRREGFRGAITMVSADESLPCDRPNLSKEYLSGKAPEDWIPLRSDEFYQEHKITLIRGMRATTVDAGTRRVTLADGRTLTFDRLLLATGAEPVRLKLPGGDLPHVHYLRTLADSRAIIGAAGSAKRAVVMGASFIGLEVAAALRMRGLEVHVVAPEAQPLERVMGAELGAFVRTLHEKQGVVFHLGDTATAIDAASVSLKSGGSVPADLVVIGVGVKPALDLAESAGLAMDRGVMVDAFLETSAPGIYAAGDIARWPDPHSGTAIRVEHWVVAERQGQAAARNMLDLNERFAHVPFFWSAHYDSTISYVGHAERWDELVVDGNLAAGDTTVTMRLAGKTLAVITVGRDLDSLRAEVAMERAAPVTP